MIKIINKRYTGGHLYHYAHFICDCLYPEIINDIFNYNKVFRIKNIDQTLGNFKKIYEEVMKNQSIEISEEEFNKIPGKSIILQPKESYCNLNCINKFRNFIFTRFTINPYLYNINYPEIVLIKRGNRKELIDDLDLQKINKNKTTGKERREINDIEIIESILKGQYCKRFKSFFLEEQPFEEQIKIFNNAKLIIMAHGAAMSNIFFCKSGTTLIEVTCNTHWEFFNTISKNLNLNHIKITKNSLDVILNSIKEIKIKSA